MRRARDVRGLTAWARRGLLLTAGSRREITFEIPSEPIDTPYSESAASIVRFWWVTTMNWALARVGAQQLEEAVDVEVVQRGLDLVEDVERARPGQEHREQEGQRGHRLLAAGQQRQALHFLAGRRDLDLDPEQVLLGLVRSSRRPPRRRRRLVALVVLALVADRAAAEHPRRPFALVDQPQPAAAAREQLRRHLLEVARGRLEHLLEALADLAVGVGDQLVQLAQRGLEVVALALELLDVGERLLVFGLGERVDRAELLAPAGQALEPAAERLALLVARARRRPARPRARAGRASCCSSCVGTRATRSPSALEADLGLGQPLARLAELGVQRRLLLGAFLELGRDVLAGLAVRSAARSRTRRGARRSPRATRLQRARHPLDRPAAAPRSRSTAASQALDAGAALGALALGPLALAARRGQLGGELHAPAGVRALVGRAPAPLDRRHRAGARARRPRRAG